MSSKSNFFRQGSGIDLVAGVFGGGGQKDPKLPAEPEPVESVTTITDDAGRAKRRKNRRLATGGSQSTVLSGIGSALKKRLGE
jgi:hypothetical protein